jgi:hypothetical protein
MLPHPIEEQSQGNSRPGPAEPALAAKQKEQVQTLETGSASIAIRIQFKGTERTIESPLTLDEVARLAWEAEFRGMRIGPFIGELIAAMVTKDLFRVVLDKPWSALLQACMRGEIDGMSNLRRAHGLYARCSFPASIETFQDAWPAADRLDECRHRRRVRPSAAQAAS